MLHLKWTKVALLTVSIEGTSHNESDDDDDVNDNGDDNCTCLLNLITVSATINCLNLYSRSKRKTDEDFLWSYSGAKKVRPYLYMYFGHYQVNGEIKTMNIYVDM